MITDTKDRLLEYIREKGSVSPKEMQDYLGITRQALFLHLPKLIRDNRVIKTGKPPKVYYQLAQKPNQEDEIELEKGMTEFIEKRYLYVSPTGEKMSGLSGFVAWCTRTGQEVTKTAKEYVSTQKKYDQWVKGGLIEGISKIKTTFPDVYLDKIYYLDFYSIERFGKTRLGQLLLYAKQSQNRQVIDELIKSINSRIVGLKNKLDIDAVCYVPPTVKREVQLMKELSRMLALNLPTVAISKLKTQIAVPQKTLSKLSDRVENATHTIVVEEKLRYKKVLLIDDAVGSGATMNEVARQLKEKGVAKKVIGLSIVGSYKGFDVISEV